MATERERKERACETVRKSQTALVKEPGKISEDINGTKASVSDQTTSLLHDDDVDDYGYDDD